MVMTNDLLHTVTQTSKLNGQNGAATTAVTPDKYHALFNASPISLWEEDFSGVKQFIDQLRQDGVTDFQAYFDAHPEDVIHCINLVNVIDINDMTLKLYQAGSKEELLANLETIFGEEAFDVFKAELIVIGNGGVLFENEGTNYTLDCEPIQVQVRWSVPPGYEETLSRVIVSITDITQRKQVEHDLHHAKEYAEQLFQLVPSAIFTVDNDRNITSWNKKAAELTGYASEEIIGKNCRLFAEAPCTNRCGLFAPEIAKPIGGAECVLRTKDGRLLTVSKNADLLYDDDGQIIGGIESLEDITDRKQMDAQLRRQLQEEELISQVISLTSSAKDLCSALEGVCEKLAHFLDVPQAAFALLNDQRTESTVVAEYLEPGRPSGLGAVIPWEGNPTSAYLLENMAPLAIPDAQHDPILEPVWALMRQRQTASMLLVPIFIDNEIVGTIGFDADQQRTFEQGDIEVVQNVAMQISQALQRKRAEKELQEQRDFAHRVMKNMGQGLAVLNTDGSIEYCNDACAQLLGYKTEDLIGQTPFFFTFVQDETEVDRFRGLWLSGETSDTEMQLKHADGTAVPALVTAVPRYRDGQVTGTIAVVTDLTKQKQIEADMAKARDQAIEASRLKSEFLANMSHEIRTPLNAVIGMTSLLLDTPLTPEQQEYSETVRNSGDVLLSLINDILDFSKIEAGKLELEMQSFNLRDCVEAALDVVVSKAAEKGLEMAYIMEDQVPQTIVGDVTRLRQVLVNLLGNAIKFTEQGEVVVHVNSQHIPGTKQYQIQFDVKDTGIGIPQNRRNRLFKSFSQVDASTTRKYGGTGLGLTISKRLVEMMNGRIWVESEAGKGSTFSFTIKAKAGAGQRRVYLYGNQPQLDGKRLLIVDDNETNRVILIKQASLWGMIPQAVASGPEALALLRENISFDVAVLDMHMPDMDGLTLAAEIRKLRSQKEMPLVMLSSVGNREGHEAEKFFSAFLTKPVKPQLLYNSLLSVFGNTAVTAKRAPKKLAIDPQMGKNHPLRILLAEDNLINQKVAIRILERMGYRADVAASGLEALEALQRQPYDVVLMDVQMPEMDGVEATEQIRDIWPQEQQPRIIAMTAHALSGDREKYLKAGMDDYISKPVRIHELAQALADSQPLAS